MAAGRAPLSELGTALARRAALPAEGTTLYRAVHTTETAGLYALDVAADVGVLSLYAELDGAEELHLAQRCAGAASLRSVYLKRRPPEAQHRANVERDYLSPPLPIWGEVAEEVVALEGGIPFLIRPGADLSIGLFTDARPMRGWVRDHVAGARVLNLYAYTCGFGLCAALGGAERVKNVDLSRKVLAWGQANYALSGMGAPDADFLYGDVFDWLRRLRKRGDLFDLIVLDPPSFARNGGEVWRADRDYGELSALAADVAAPGARLLTLLNHAGVAPGAFERMVSAGLNAAGRSGHIHTRLAPGPDYPGATHLKAHVWQLNDV